MSQQLTISSLISAFALISLCLVARAGDLAQAYHGDPALVQVAASAKLDV